MSEVLGHSAVCECCGTVATFEFGDFRDFFEGAGRMCSECGRKLPSLWLAACDYIRTCRSPWTDQYRLFSPLRPGSVTFEIEVAHQKSTKVQLEDYQVPASAPIVGITYWALDENVTPVELTGWIHPDIAAKTLEADGTFRFPPGLSRSLRRLDLPHDLTVVAADIGRRAMRPARVAVAVEWLNPDESEITSETIFWALEAFGAGRLHAAVVLSQVAVELKLDEFFAHDKRKRSYYKLMKLLCTARELGAPAFEGELGQIYNLVDNMRERRNEFVHSGKWELGASATADILCATVFIIHYINMLRKACSPPS